MKSKTINIRVDEEFLKMLDEVVDHYKNHGFNRSDIMRIATNDFYERMNDFVKNEKYRINSE